MNPSDTDHNNSDRNVPSSTSNTDSHGAMIQTRTKAVCHEPKSALYYIYYICRAFPIRAHSHYTVILTQHVICSISDFCFVYSQYPPAPFSLFFFDQIRRWKENQQKKVQQEDHACMMTSGNNDNVADVANDDSTNVQDTLQQRGQPHQPRQGRRELTNFAKQVFIASNRWKQLSNEERQIWEQRAAEAAEKQMP